MDTDPDAVHRGFLCDECTGGIRGVLWHQPGSGNAPSTSFSLCQSCYDDGEVEDNMIAVRIPAHLLHEACTDGNLPAVQKILTQEALMINMKISGSTPLAQSVIFKHPPIVDLLLAHPTIDPNIRIAKFTQTPLEYAIHNRDEEMALKLLAHPLIRIKCCLHKAAENGMVGVFDALLSHPDANLAGFHEKGVTVLHEACSRSGDVAIVRKIIEAAVIDIDVRDPIGQTPLMWAVKFGRFDLVETLLSAGADVEILSNTGRNAFHYSVNRNDEDSKMTRLLCDHVTRHSFLPLYARYYEKKTPMYYAVKRGQLRTVQMFLDAGFDVNHKEINSKSLLHISVEFFGFLLSPEYLRESSNFAMTKMLLDNGADCNATDHKNCTPLHYAVSSIDDLREFHPTLLLLLGRQVDLDIIIYQFFSLKDMSLISLVKTR